MFGSGELLAVAVRDSRRPVGLAPMFLHHWNDRRQVTFLGNGASDRLDPLLHPECEAQAGAAVIAALEECRRQWDLCDLQDMRADCPLARRGR